MSDRIVVPTRYSTKHDAAAAQARERLLVGVRIQERCVDVNGVDTCIIEAGTGPSLILLHGGIECGGAYWGPIVSRLAESHRVIVPDVPGFGQSAPFPAVTAHAFIAWLSALIELTCDDKPALVAHSVIGNLAARFAADHSPLLRSLVLYGAPGIVPYRMPLVLLVAAIRFDLRASPANFERVARLALFDLEQFRRRDPVWFGAFSAYVRARAAVPHVKRTMRRFVRAGTRQVPEADLRRIDVPTALVWGVHDRFVPLHDAERASARLGWPLITIDDASHVPHIDRPEVFLAALQATLSIAPQRQRDLVLQNV